MQLRFKKVLAFICAFAMICAAHPLPAKAAATPKFTKTYATLFENGDKGFTYTITGVKKGQSVRWSVIGDGARYLKLNKTSAKITGSKTKNKVIVRTNGELAAKNKVVNIIANVYNKNGTLACTLSGGDAKIGVRPTKIELMSSDVPAALQVGTSYQFGYKITPVNSTATIRWSAKYEDGTDASDCITSAGKFTPKKEGRYTLTVQALIGKNLYASDLKTVSVSTSMLTARQSAVDKFLIIYPDDVSKTLRKESFQVKNIYGTTELIKDAAFSADGREVTLTMYNSLRNGETYTLSDGRSSKEILAAVGTPVRMEILTTEVTVNKQTLIEYALYDSNGIDVTSLYPGVVRFSDPVTVNGYGYITADSKRIVLTAVGTIMTFTATCIFNSPSVAPLTAQGSITCTPAKPSNDTNFTLTKNSITPNYLLPSYKDNRKVEAGSVYYMHFRALDTDKAVLQYESVTYESTNPDVLLIYNNRATAIREGAATVIVTAVYGGQSYTYSYQVEISPQPYLTSISLSETYVYTSNAYPADYRKYVDITAYNQFGQSYDLAGGLTVVENYSSDSTATRNLLTHDPANNRLIITPNACPAGTYYYTVSATSGNNKVSTHIYIVVQAPPASGVASYEADIDQKTLDLTPNAETDINTYVTSKAISVRLAETRSSVFSAYHDIAYAYITKDGLYYSLDLTAAPSVNPLQIRQTGQQLVINTVKRTGIGNTYQKAAAGTYYVELFFYPNDTGTTANPAIVSRVTASFEIRDSQMAPTVTVSHTTASRLCSTTTELAKDCLVPSIGDIVSCTVLGESIPNRVLGPNESVYIQTVTIRVRTAIANGQFLESDTVVNVGRVLQNIPYSS